MFLLAWMYLKPQINTHDPHGHLQTRAQQHGHHGPAGGHVVGGCRNLTLPLPGAMAQQRLILMLQSIRTAGNENRLCLVSAPGPRPMVHAETMEGRTLLSNISLQCTTHALLQEQPRMEQFVAQK